MSLQQWWRQEQIGERLRDSTLANGSTTSAWSWWRTDRCSYRMKADEKTNQCRLFFLSFWFILSEVSQFFPARFGFHVPSISSCRIMRKREGDGLLSSFWLYIFDVGLVLEETLPEVIICLLLKVSFVVLVCFEAIYVHRFDCLSPSKLCWCEHIWCSVWNPISEYLCFVGLMN